ncbi:MAG: hypothetical protein K0R31_1906 [Clostridiales bacterium]|nr:hypothetical protein [Clostridiales bacterium]
MLYTCEMVGNMDNVFEISLLLDFYGMMLTPRLYEILDLHYNNDYSLGEIAEQLNISRQGVHDNIKRGKAILNELENKLGLLNKFLMQKEKASSLLKVVENIDSARLGEKDLQQLDQLKRGIKDMIDSI